MDIMEVIFRIPDQLDNQSNCVWYFLHSSIYVAKENTSDVYGRSFHFGGKLKFDYFTIDLKQDSW